MAGYIGSKSSVTLVDGYSEAEADAEFVNDPNDVITVSGSNVGIDTSSPQAGIDVESSAKGIFTSGNVYPYPTGNAYIKVKGTNAEHNWIGITGGYEQSSGSANLMLQPNFRLTNEQAGNYIGSEAQSVTTADITFGKLVGGSSTSTNATKSEFMRIDSSGNVGIGGTPSNQLHLQKSADNGVVIENTTGATLSLLSTGAGRVRSSGVLLFDTGGATERMRIDSSGKVLINRTSTAEDCKMNINHGSSWGLILDGDGSGTDNHIMFSRSGSTRGYITSSSTSVSYNTSSDYRLKENVVDLTGASARVNQLNPSRFNFITDADKTVDGFLAHEVADVVPEAITGTKDAMRDEEYEVTPAVEATYDEDGNELTAAVEAVMGTRSVPDYQGIDQSKLVPLLTAALQEALTEIASLKTRVEALEA